ncbi:IS4 family transposase [Pseudoalteromonas piscicida]|uniref:IS4 family transposase n=1 Tax=Pseudoalteromonas piscicida TaxID=43662 RepID=UPI0030C9E766
MKSFSCSLSPDTFSNSNLSKLALSTGFQVRSRCLTISKLIRAAFKALSCQQDANLSDIHRNLNAEVACDIEYKPFHNQIRKPELVKLLQQLTIQAMSSLSVDSLEPTYFAQRGINRVLIQDGSSFALHDGLKQAFTGRFNTVSPAAIELHATYDLFSEMPCVIDVRPDVEPERNFLPGSHTLKDTLLLADAGYFDLAYFEQVKEAGGYFMARASNRINPTVLSVNLSGIEFQPTEQKLQSVIAKFGSQPLEMTVQWGSRSPKYRLLYVPDKKRPVLLLTNLCDAQFNFDELLDIYAIRWQIELFFKELKSWNNLKGFMTTDPHIAESLVWLSLLQALMKRFVCHSASRLWRCAISTFKANKIAYLWVDDILECFDLQCSQKKLNEVLEILATHCQRGKIKRDCKLSRFIIGTKTICVA